MRKSSMDLRKMPVLSFVHFFLRNLLDAVCLLLTQFHSDTSSDTIQSMDCDRLNSLWNTGDRHLFVLHFMGLGWFQVLRTQNYSQTTNKWSFSGAKCYADDMQPQLSVIPNTLPKHRNAFGPRKCSPINFKIEAPGTNIASKLSYHSETINARCAHRVRFISKIAGKINWTKMTPQFQSHLLPEIQFYLHFIVFYSIRLLDTYRTIREWKPSKDTATLLYAYKTMHADAKSVRARKLKKSWCMISM